MPERLADDEPPLLSVFIVIETFSNLPLPKQNRIVRLIEKGAFESAFKELGISLIDAENLGRQIQREVRAAGFAVTEENEAST